jgi:transcriptional regulator NrdR family protein
MICPNCKSDQTAVIDSRQFKAYRRRRYKCLECGERFTTKEVVVEVNNG